jgi:membrane-bound lytic murein transglycosylase F
MRKKIIYILFIPVLVGLILCACSDRQNDHSEKDHLKTETELTRIMKSGKLKAVVDYNSTNYFIYQGIPMGFKYEILQHLAKDMQVKLEISVNNNQEDTFKELIGKKYDLIAKNLPVTKERNQLVAFTEPLEQTRQVLVQRKPKNWRLMTEKALEDSLIRNQLNLAGKQVYVQKNSVYYKRMVNLSEEIGEDIDIVQDSIYGMEQLIAMVAKGDIDYTVCDENMAKVNQIYYPDLDVETPVSFPQNIAWAVREDSPEWLSYLNNWIINFRQSSTYRILYQKYFVSPRSGTRFKSDYYSYTNGKLSLYDDVIREVCREEGMDWRFIVAVIRQESNFDATAESWSGAYGLMQVLPESADLFKIQDYKSPKGNIQVGVNLLKWLDEHFKEEVLDSAERIKFTLAAYNVGLGHVQDAQRLAEKYDRTPIVWNNNVDYFLRNKSVAKYYRDPVVRYGYCRGEESYYFVNTVLDTYHHYCNIIGEE